MINLWFQNLLEFLKGFDDLFLDPRFPLSVSSRGVGSVAFTVRLPRLCTRWSDLVTSWSGSSSSTRGCFPVRHVPTSTVTRSKVSTRSLAPTPTVTSRGMLLTSRSAFNGYSASGYYSPGFASSFWSTGCSPWFNRLRSESCFSQPFFLGSWPGFSSGLSWFV
ncbi:hypothetical protein ADUPG1_002909 [Aduncisulcus paluster]|uniref:Uncharacterized protein n=1 Tax=Aduncisulcus paluster TaxID=2918883 RepID=A0ABQ5KUC7_9EUKA|nr:hypothetical protein ADUPG1_002909 [Aduncisulcus paluster]